MIAVFSFFSLPFLHHNRMAHGLVDNTFFYQCWMLSVLYAKKHFPEVRLVTDNAGKEILCDLLELPFDKVSLELNSIQHIFPELWAYGKVIAYKSQSQPFLHIDYDAFFFNPLPEDIKNSAVIAESKEDFSEFVYYTNNHKFLKELGYVSAYFPPRPSLNHAFNCGVFGGTNLPFIKSYCEEAEKIVHFIQQHPAAFYAHDSLHRYLFSIVFEQSNLAFCLAHHRLSPRLLLKHPGASDFPGYTHLKGAKLHPHVKQRVAARLLNDFPDHWNRYIFKTIISNPKNRPYHEPNHHHFL